MEGATFQRDKHFRGWPFDNLPFDGPDAPSFGGLDSHGVENGSRDPGIGRAGVHEELERLSTIRLLWRSERYFCEECPHQSGPGSPSAVPTIFGHVSLALPDGIGVAKFCTHQA